MSKGIAIHKNARLSRQKAALLADLVRGKHVEEAIKILSHTPKKAAVLIKKVMDSAIANAEHNEGADIDELRVSKIFVDQGPTLKRMHPRARGRSDRILKRTCHITVVVSDN